MYWKASVGGLIALFLFKYLFEYLFSLFGYSQIQYPESIGVDVCPGPFIFPEGIREEIKEYFINTSAVLCARTSIGLPGEYNSIMMSRSIHGTAFVGPQWNDYREIFPKWDCGKLYNDATKENVCGRGNEYLVSPYPNGPQLSSGNTPPGCQVTGCDPAASDNTWYCNPVGYGAKQNGGCFCPFGGINNALGNPEIDNPGCYVEPRFNWIIGACQGSSCNGIYNDVYDSTGKILVNTSNLRPYKNVGTRLVLNYVAAYNYNVKTGEWVMDSESSFNVDAKKKPYDVMKPYGGLNKSDAWLVPQVGGSVQWGWGFHPIGVKGVGPLSYLDGSPDMSGRSGGMMFVLSTEESYNFAWYMLNQVNLDRGAGSPPCEYKGKKYPNCWNAGNSGEIDFLESPFGANKAFIDNYSRLYLNNINQFGRCFPSMLGALSGGWGGNWERSTMMTGTNPMEDPKPFVYVAVVDKIGVFVYRIPGDEIGGIWEGLERKTAEMYVDGKPKLSPKDFQPCGLGKEDYCMMFIPNCEANTAEEAKKMSCDYTDNQGFCENWFQLLANTGQWQWNGEIWTENVTDPYVSNGGIKLSWEKAMAPYQLNHPYN